MVNVKTIGEIQLGLGIALILFVMLGTIITIGAAKIDLDDTQLTAKTDFESNLNTFIQAYQDINDKYNLTTEEEAQKTMSLLFNSAGMKYSYENFLVTLKYNYRNFVYLILVTAVILTVLAVILILQGLSDWRIETEFKEVETEIEEEKSTDKFKI
jgi:hypothetical protein